MGRSVNSNDFRNRVSILTNYEYVVLGDYESSSTKILMYHKTCNNTYEVTPNNFLKGRRCPYCAGKVIIGDKNSLAAKVPDLLKEWDYDKNKKITPDAITPFSNKKVWWTCKNGHSWQANPNSRMRGIGCPTCYRDRVLKYSSKHNNRIQTEVNKYNVEVVCDYRIDECRGSRPIPFSLAIFHNEKLVGLIDYKNKYYSEQSRKVKKVYCQQHSLPYFYIELVNNIIDEDSFKSFQKWLEGIIRKNNIGGGNIDAL